MIDYINTLRKEVYDYIFKKDEIHLNLLFEIMNPPKKKLEKSTDNNVRIVEWTIEKGLYLKQET